MKNEFIPYEEALALRELGFDEPCLAFYKLGDSKVYYDTILQSKNVHFRTNSELNFYEDLKEKISAPLYQQAFRWFREKYQLVGTILGDGFNGELKGYYYSITEDGWINYYESIDDSKWFDTYQEAELACLSCLIQLVEIAKNKK